MHPFEQLPPDLPLGVSPHLEVRLKPGWRFDSRRRVLVSDEDHVVRLRGLLPSGARVTPMVPSLADADRGSLSEDEQFLARYLQVALPPGTDPTDLAATLRNLDGVELVSSPPRIGLP